MKEILEALLSGKKIASQGWPQDKYIYLDDKGHIREESGGLVSDFYFNDRMFIYEEPKKKVELFLWAFPGGQDFYATLNTSFMTEKEAKLAMGKDAIKTNISITVEI